MDVGMEYEQEQWYSNNFYMDVVLVAINNILYLIQQKLWQLHVIFNLTHSTLITLVVLYTTKVSPNTTRSGLLIANMAIPLWNYPIGWPYPVPPPIIIYQLCGEIGHESKDYLRLPNLRQWLPPIRHVTQHAKNTKLAYIGMHIYRKTTLGTIGME
jgi:hypothetical protein